MSEKIVQNVVSKIIRYTIKVGYKNGGNETVFAIKAPAIIPNTSLMSLLVKDGFEVIINMQEVRRMEILTEVEVKPRIIV